MFYKVLNSIQIWSIMYIRKGICLVFKIPRILTKLDILNLCNITFLRWLHLKNVCEFKPGGIFLSLIQPQSCACFNVYHPLLPLTFRDSFHVKRSSLSFPWWGCLAAYLLTHSCTANAQGWTVTVPLAPLLAFSLAGKIQTRNYKLLVKV